MRQSSITPTHRTFRSNKRADVNVKNFVNWLWYQIVISIKVRKQSKKENHHSPVLFTRALPKFFFLLVTRTRHDDDHKQPPVILDVERREHLALWDDFATLPFSRCEPCTQDQSFRPYPYSNGLSCSRGAADIVSASCELGLGLGLGVLYGALHDAFFALLGGFLGHLDVLACC